MVQESKKSIRLELLRRMLSLTKEEIKRRSGYVGKMLYSLPLYRKAKCIMGFYPLKGEVDLLEMIKKVSGKKICFPVMDLKAKNLSAFQVNNFEKDFVKGPYGVSQPDPKKAKEIDISKIDMILVPGLAFDLKKNRLGRGAGFYDRFLKNALASTTKVGVAFKFQVLNNLPINLSFDQPMDFLVSEDFII